MNYITNFLSVLAVIGAIASGGFYFLNLQEANNLSQELQIANTQLSTTQSKNIEQSSKIDDLSAQLQQSNQTLEETRSNITVIMARSNQLKRENGRLSDELDMRLDKEESLQIALADLKKEMAELRANSISLDKATAYEQEIASLEARILQLKNSQATASTVSLSDTYRTLKTAPGGLSGQILTVGPKSSFVVINLGYISGVRLDHLLEIQRDGKLVANIQVTEVKENLSIARILPESMENDPETGDIVISGNL
ncbi:MAG: hypothetical protein VYC82_05020 [Verrucomicrobiota bacterium]|nr:hypothetical protein [Verrucomicrobiota bacterium]